MLALSIGKLISKKSTDAKNLLKILWKKTYSTDNRLLLTGYIFRLI